MNSKKQDMDKIVLQSDSVDRDRKASKPIVRTWSDSYGRAETAVSQTKASIVGKWVESKPHAKSDQG